MHVGCCALSVLGSAAATTTDGAAEARPTTTDAAADAAATTTTTARTAGETRVHSMCGCVCVGGAGSGNGARRIGPKGGRALGRVLRTKSHCASAVRAERFAEVAGWKGGRVGRRWVVVL